MNKKIITIKKTDTLFNRKTLLYLFIALLFTGFLFRNSLHAEFLSYDDTENVVNNLSIQNLSINSIGSYFSSVNLYMYTPITTISYAIDYQIDGLNPFYFKLTNLLLHLINIILVYILSFQLLKKNNLAIFVAIIFALHPINTDTISWISTRSNLLATLFFLLSLISYHAYISKPALKFLILSFVSFALSILSKSSGIMLPFTLFLFDYLYHRKLNYKIILEKIPFLFLSIAIGLLTLYFRTDSGNPQAPVEYSFFDRFFLISYSLTSYVIKVIFPFHLSEIYAYPIKTGNFLPIIYYLSFALIILFIIAIDKLKNYRREIIFGFIFFLLNIIITLIPILEDGFLANRYTYLPFFGLFFITIKTYELIISNYQKSKVYFSVLAVACLIIFSSYTYQRSMHWKNTLTLFNRVIEKEPDAAFAYNSRGIAKYMLNDLEGSFSDYNKAIQLYPKYSSAFYNRGIVFNARKEFENAYKDYTRAIELNPNFASSYLARGIIEMEVLKNDSMAICDYNESIKNNPSFPQAYYNRGIAKMRMNKVSEACDDFWMVKKLGYPNADKIIEHYCY
jgi:protein O-mannosyl-transferase